MGCEVRGGEGGCFLEMVLVMFDVCDVGWYGGGSIVVCKSGHEASGLDLRDAGFGQPGFGFAFLEALELW